jgi:DNA adenine methylase
MNPSCLRWPGGKQAVAKEIVDLFPPNIIEYREPMCGGASVYFEARHRGLAQSYWINDVYRELINFWECAGNRMTNDQMVERLRDLLTSSEWEVRAHINMVRGLMRDGFAWQRGADFFLLNRCSFSGTTLAGGIKGKLFERFTESSVCKLARVQPYLAGAKITAHDCCELINKEGVGVFLFLDPPYTNAKKLYGLDGELHDFGHEILARKLFLTQHKFLLTLDDSPYVRELYKWANVREWSVQYGMNNCNKGNTSKRGPELLISNYELGVNT